MRNSIFSQLNGFLKNQNLMMKDSLGNPYTQSHFDTLLETLANIKGKFLLSSYPNERLAEMTPKQCWLSKPIDMALSASNTRGKRKVEMLTRNYEVLSCN